MFKNSSSVIPFKALADFVSSHRALWQEHSFYLGLGRDPDWVKSQPDLAKAVAQLSLSQAQDLADSDSALWQFLAQTQGDFKPLAQLCALPPSTVGLNTELNSQLNTEFESHFNTGIPGRKWQQIKAFLASVPNPSGEFLEWCGGKAHLGRAASQLWQASGSSFDIDPVLVRAAEGLSNKHLSNTNQSKEHLASTLVLKHYCCDAFSAQAEQLLGDHSHALALHACGGLHVQLIKKAAEHKLPRLTIAPCCYHRFNPQNNFKPISERASQYLDALELNFTELDLRTAVTMSATAQAYDRRTRSESQIWRLGFDELQRDVLRRDEYRPMPSFSKTWLKGSFEAFCRRQWLQLGYSEDLLAVNFADYLDKGAQRFLQVSQYDLARLAFRRAIELVVVYDRAMFLEEQGYTVELSEFCDSSVSPRNILLQAQRLSI